MARFGIGHLGDALEQFSDRLDCIGRWPQILILGTYDVTCLLCPAGVFVEQFIELRPNFQSEFRDTV